MSTVGANSTTFQLCVQVQGNKSNEVKFDTSAVNDHELSESTGSPGYIITSGLYKTYFTVITFQISISV